MWLLKAAAHRLCDGQLIAGEGQLSSGNIDEHGAIPGDPGIKCQFTERAALYHEPEPVLNIRLLGIMDVGTSAHKKF